MCQPDNWSLLQGRVRDFESGSVECCSFPIVSEKDESDTAAQVMNWWKRVEQQSLCKSFEFSHLLHTDVSDCYGSLYTHSIAWAIHGLQKAKQIRDTSLLGNRIDKHIRDGRYGQTNGISQGSVLIDFIAEIVLGFVDMNITSRLGSSTDFSILRYRDDYRIFTNSDNRAEEILKVISDELRGVGMRLGVSKTFTSTNIIEGSIKADKMAGINLQDIGKTNARTIQKQLLRIHAFGRKFPNSGALRRLSYDYYEDICNFYKRICEYLTAISLIRYEDIQARIFMDVDNWKLRFFLYDFYKKIYKALSLLALPNDLEVQVAISVDIAYISPNTFPAIAGVLSLLISLANDEDKATLWNKVRTKMQRLPYNGYLEIWLQRIAQGITRSSLSNIEFQSEEKICQIVQGDHCDLWNSYWIKYSEAQSSLDTSTIVISEALEEVSEVIQPQEIALFKKSIQQY
jgi:hypothetical protein